MYQTVKNPTAWKYNNRVFSHILWTVNLWNFLNGNFVILILSSNLFILGQAVLFLRIYSTNPLDHVCMPWLFIAGLFSYSKRFKSLPLEDWLNRFTYIMKTVCSCLKEWGSSLYTDIKYFYNFCSVKKS